MESEKPQADNVETVDDSHTSSGADVPAKTEAEFLPNEARDEDVVTLKTWIVVTVRSIHPN